MSITTRYKKPRAIKTRIIKNGINGNFISFQILINGIKQAKTNKSMLIIVAIISGNIKTLIIKPMNASKSKNNTKTHDFCFSIFIILNLTA
jgi:hypothetical protein